MLGKFLEGAGAATPLDRPGHALGQQQPPGDDVPVPGVDDHVNVLVEEIALDDVGGSLSTVEWTNRSIPSSTASMNGPVFVWPHVLADIAARPVSTE